MRADAPDLALLALRCRTSDRSPGGARGVDALARTLAQRLGTEPRSLGEPAQPRSAGFEEDLASSHGCLAQAGAALGEAVRSGATPVLVAAECSVAVATLPAVARERPDARVLWLDAHGDYNTPGTTGSGYLGGMCLAAACGEWDTGFEPPIDPTRVVLAGVRDLDEPERELLADARVAMVGASSASPQRTRIALDGAPVFVHLDVDVLDPEEFPATPVPAPGGLSEAALADLLTAVAEDCELIGVEITAFEGPEDERERSALAARLADLAEALLKEGSG